MTTPKLTEQELQNVIMARLAKEPECVAITQVYVRSTGLQPPEENLGALPSLSAPQRAPTRERNDALLKVINALRAQYDLIPD
jgi:hypothetical protein